MSTARQERIKRDEITSFDNDLAETTGRPPSAGYLELVPPDNFVPSNGSVDLLQQKAASLEAEIAALKTDLRREQLARESAEKASRLKDDFLGMISHEMRTPLNVIIGWATILLDGRLNEAAAKRAIETIDNNARQQSRLIDDILEASRAISGRTGVSLMPIDISTVVAATVKSFRPSAEAKKIELEFECSSESATVKGDPGRLQRVFGRLLSNAIKFTPDNGRISVSVQADQTSVDVKIRDTGCGISPESLPYIFDHFRRPDGSRARAKGGLGLGLSIVKHLVELHGGTVSAESDGDALGAAFTVRLPREI